MPQPRPDYRRRTLLSFSQKEIDQLTKAARREKLPLATFLRRLILLTTSPANGSGSR